MHSTHVAVWLSQRRSGAAQFESSRHCTQTPRAELQTGVQSLEQSPVLEQAGAQRYAMGSHASSGEQCSSRVHSTHVPVLGSQ
jgi:hypothetical protein